MPCLIAAIALFFPRIVIVVMFLFTTYLHTAYQTVLWPLLGFIFLPLTTLAYAFAINQHGSLDGLYLAIFVIAVLVDLGVFGGSGAAAKRRR
jgi:hypothetical protein